MMNNYLSICLFGLFITNNSMTTIIFNIITMIVMYTHINRIVSIINSDSILKTCNIVWIVSITTTTTTTTTSSMIIFVITNMSSMLFGRLLLETFSRFDTSCGRR